MFGYSEGDFKITEHVSERTIALPFYNNLKQEEMHYVVDNLLLNLDRLFFWVLFILYRYNYSIFYLTPNVTLPVPACPPARLGAQPGHIS